MSSLRVVVGGRTVVLPPLALGLALLAASLVFAGCGSSDSESAGLGSEFACGHAKNVAKDWVDGVLTIDELRQKLREVEEAPDPGVSAAARHAVAAATAGDSAALNAAWGELLDACVAIGAMERP